ncbi:MAG: hypothetical protein J6B90_02305 [Lachnospiraceae bacterium]|nr:hypothetical protein [Lachnospiraceae bacterium]
MLEDDSFFEDDDWEEENDSVYDTWDLVFRSMTKEISVGKCHTHIYKSIQIPEKMLHYCYMNRWALTQADTYPTYEEAEAVLDFMTGHGYELQYDLADGQLYRFDWNSKSEFQEREKYSLEEVALFCRDMAGELLEYAVEQGDEAKELVHASDLFNSWCARFTNGKKRYAHRD